jgi:hypothetical protein
MKSVEKLFTLVDLSIHIPKICSRTLSRLYFKLYLKLYVRTSFIYFKTPLHFDLCQCIR